MELLLQPQITRTILGDHTERVLSLEGDTIVQVVGYTDGRGNDVKVDFVPQRVVFSYVKVAQVGQQVFFQEVSSRAIEEAFVHIEILDVFLVHDVDELRREVHMASDERRVEADTNAGYFFELFVGSDQENVDSPERIDPFMSCGNACFQVTRQDSNAATDQKRRRGVDA